MSGSTGTTTRRPRSVAETATSISALHHAVPALERHLVQADDRDAVEVLEGGLDRRVLDDVGDDLDVDALVAEARDEAHELAVVLRGAARRRAGRRGCASSTARASSMRPEQRQRPAGASLAASSARKPTTPVAELAVGEERLGHRARRARPVPATSDARDVLAGGPLPLLVRADRRAARARSARDVEHDEEARTPPGCTPSAAPRRAGSGSRRARTASRPRVSAEAISTLKTIAKSSSMRLRPRRSW